MSYCVNCGVELAVSEKKCPLCGVTVVNPNLEEAPSFMAPFPAHSPHAGQQISRYSLILLLTFIFLIPILLCVVCDVSINDQIIWSGYVLGAFIQLYITIVVPILVAGKKFRGRWALCLLLDTAALLGFLKYIEWAAGGVWFFSFAFPTIAAVTASIAVICLLSEYTGMSRLARTAVGSILTGGFCLALELLINAAFGAHSRLVWSLYPLITLSLLGTALFYIDHNKEMKEKLIQKFFL